MLVVSRFASVQRHRESWSGPQRNKNFFAKLDGARCIPIGTPPAFPATRRRNFVDFFCGRRSGLRISGKYACPHREDLQRRRLVLQPAR